jgi:4-amino-4-deoxy-L-arabinose transferase-like glycosyltransferase
VVLLSFIMLLAAFLRFYRLDTIPIGIPPDIATNGIDALYSLKTGDYKVFYSDNYGREGLMIWLDVISISFFGVNALAMRIPAAIAGTLTVLGIYLLSRKMLARNDIALTAAFFCSVLFWHINFSRLGFRSILVPFFLVFSMFFLWKAFDENNALSGIISGALFGLGFYTYPSFRFGVLLLFGILISWFFALNGHEKEQFIKINLLILLSALFISLPIGVYFFFHPHDLVLRAEGVSYLWKPSPLPYFVKSLTSHLLMFNIRGDPNWTHNSSGMPELFFPVGILFLIGMYISIKKSYQKEYFTLLIWFICLLLPGILTFEGIPHSQRVIGVIPTVMILAGIGSIAVLDWMRLRISKRTLILIALVFIFVIILQGYYQYFILWSNNPTTLYGNVMDWGKTQTLIIGHFTSF